MLCALFNYIMGDKIRRLNMNIEFEDIWPKGLNCLTHGRIVYLYIMYQSLHDYDYLSTKHARQSTEGYTHDGRFVVEVSKIRSEMVTRHKI